MLIGHMQHNARDPHRDHVHGRIYRITYPSRPLVKPAKIDGASIPELLDNLKIYEDRTRYRTRRELRGRDTAKVLPAVKKWVAGLDKNDPDYERLLLEAMWVTWGHDQIDQDLVRQLLKSKDHRVRSAATRAVRYNGHQMADQVGLLKAAAKDPHGRVRVEAITAASWLPKNKGLAILDIAQATGLDRLDQRLHAVCSRSIEQTPLLKKKKRKSKFLRISQLLMLSSSNLVKKFIIVRPTAAPVTKQMAKDFLQVVSLPSLKQDGPIRM